VDSLSAEVCACLKRSPAVQGGLLKGDIILKIDDYAPLTRVDCYNELYKRCNPKLQVLRNGRELSLNIEKNADTSSGAVFYYDIHPDTIYSIDTAVQRYRAKTPLVVTSLLGLGIIKLGAQRLLSRGIHICAIENKWFGGSIMCAGLLTVGDIINGIAGDVKNYKPDLIILPPSPFDLNGRDLSGRYFHEIEEAVGVRTVIAE
jgi:NifB/MoaA-like Fe-S oxidoreductase